MAEKPPHHTDGPKYSPVLISQYHAASLAYFDERHDFHAYYTTWCFTGERSPCAPSHRGTGPALVNLIRRHDGRLTRHYAISSIPHYYYFISLSCYINNSYLPLRRGRLLAQKVPLYFIVFCQQRSGTDDEHRTHDGAWSRSKQEGGGLTSVAHFGQQPYTTYHHKAIAGARFEPLMLISQRCSPAEAHFCYHDHFMMISYIILAIRNYFDVIGLRVAIPTENMG